jgi:hypothetical protein
MCCLLKLNIGCECFYLCRLFIIDWFKPEIVTGQYITHAQEFQTLYFLVGIASEFTCEARIGKIAKNIEFLILKEI